MSEPLGSAVAPTGVLLERGSEISLKNCPGRRNGRYVITNLERESSGKVVLTIFGPLGRPTNKQHYINPSAIAVVHRIKKLGR